MNDLTQRARSAKATDEFQRFADDFGARVRAARKSRGWTLEIAGERCGLAWRHLQRVETGKVNVSLVTILRLAEGLGVEPAAFFLRVTPG